VRTDKRSSQKTEKKAASRAHKRGIVGYSKKTALLEEAIGHMNSGKYGRSSAALKDLLALDPQNTEARRLFATLHLRLGSLVTARQAFESLANEAIGRQDYWLAESLLREYLAAGPRCVPFLEQLAHVHLEKGDEMAAVAELGKAIEILRDDPDAENPQKAAQLYSKIRELAPASSVALELAPLFDVQTGEFLAKPADPSTTTSDDSTRFDDAVLLQDTSPTLAGVEHPLPEVMPWELPEEPNPLPTPDLAPEPDLVGDFDVTPDPQVSQETQAACGFEAEEKATAPEDISPDSEMEVPQTAASPSTDAETTFSFRIMDDTAADSSLSSPSIPSPMPWEQMADASVQIVEPEIPPAPEPSIVEPVSTSFFAIQEAEVPPPAAAEEPPPASTDDQDTPVAVLSELGLTESAALSAPMPWEQVSDPAIQIPIHESAPSLPTDLEISSTPTIGEVPVESQATIEESEASPMQSSQPEPQPSTPSAEETPSSTSFSWNNVFDKAWTFTAGALAPSPTSPAEDRPEPPGMGPPLAEEVTTADSLAVEPPSSQEEPAGPVAPPMPVASSLVDEQVTQDVASPPSADTPAAAPTTASPLEASSHWNTGEVAVQVHRPSKKKKRWEKEHLEDDPSTGSPSIPQPLSETDQEPIREWRSTTEEPIPPVQPVQAEVSPTVDMRPDWMQASETITINRPEPSPRQAGWSDADTTGVPAAETTNPAAISAIDVLFSHSATTEDTQPHVPASWSKPRPRLMARLHRVRIGVSSFIGSCFSTTRSLSFLALMVTIAITVVTAAGVSALGVMWMVMEDPPSPLYQALTVSPPRMVTDAKKNGYFLLLGFDVPVGHDPVQAGYERRPDPEKDRAETGVCTGDETRESAGSGGASNHVVKSWVRNGDPLMHMREHGVTLKSLASRESTALARYQQWLAMPFDDWGFGQSFSPNCPHVLLAHRLFLLEGFDQDLPTGLDRLEADLQAWRSALGQSKTLAMKMLAATAVQDDVSMVSGLLGSAELDAAALARLSKLVRPLDQVELSVRWPMQSQFVWATKTVQSDLKEDKADDRPWHASVAAAMRLPVQRRANAYAEYYDAANKAVAGGRYTNLPKVSAYIRTPPAGVMDYLANPLEHIVGIEPLPSWDPYVIRMVEVDAQLRLAGLQAWLRRGPQDSDVLTRLAKAGQAYYDPFTGLPMLVNQRRGVIYSVGHDGKDQEGDDIHDVTVMIPPSFSESRRHAVSASMR
jgi:hypothetical protein